MTFPDFDEYVKTREQAYADYENREEWVQKMLVNIAKAGYFSSDRTIEEYNRDIWKLEDQSVFEKDKVAVQQLKQPLHSNFILVEFSCFCTKIVIKWK